mmetsp:Transcript_16737/g.32553  ORF Transcript_16737/g.32553 Transcript_16737/m.32553 type:complete len:428 (+) Transcript_16737:103-1386(+)
MASSGSASFVGEDGGQNGHGGDLGNGGTSSNGNGDEGLEDERSMRGLENEDEDEGTGSEDGEDVDGEDGENLDGEDDEGAAALMSKRLFEIRTYLQGIDKHPFQSFEDIREKLEIDLNVEEELLERLEKSDMILVDKEKKEIKFEPRFDVFDIPSLLRALDKYPDGIPVEEIKACGPIDILLHVHKAIIWGLVIALRNRNAAGGTSPYVLFPRGPSFLVPVSGRVTAEPGKSVLKTTCDIQPEIHRGDSLLLGRDAVDAFLENELDVLETRCLRVSNEPFGAPQPLPERELAVIVERLQRNQVPYSRSSADPPRPPKEGDYKLVFTDSKVPINPSIAKEATPLEGVTALKHGCTNDVKELWREVCKKHHYRAQQSPVLDRLLTENNLTTAERLAQSGQTVRKRKVRTSSKPKRRTNRARKITNAHID